MTQIDFYTHVDDRFRVACTLSAKAYSRGMRVVVYAPDPEVASSVDRLLWTVPATGFVPHCPEDHTLAPRTPVIVQRRPENFSCDELLINLDHALPTFFSRFQRLVEIVGLDESDRQAARERYRFYRDRGYDIRSHDLGKNQGA